MRQVKRQREQSEIEYTKESGLWIVRGSNWSIWMGQMKRQRKQLEVEYKKESICGLCNGCNGTVERQRERKLTKINTNH
jgi:hypothetical protein